MKKLTLATMLAVSLTLAGCATHAKFTQEEVAQANYGEMTYQKADRIIKARLRQVLKDPHSAKYAPPLEVKKHWASDTKGNKYYGWLAAYRINAKNSYGGFVGEKFNVVFIVNDRVIAEWVDRGGYYVEDPMSHELPFSVLLIRP